MRCENAKLFFLDPIMPLSASGGWEGAESRLKREPGDLSCMFIKLFSEGKRRFA